MDVGKQRGSEPQQPVAAGAQGLMTVTLSEIQLEKLFNL
jgi:hypothetical protein